MPVAPDVIRDGDDYLILLDPAGLRQGEEIAVSFRGGDLVLIQSGSEVVRVPSGNFPEEIRAAQSVIVAEVGNGMLVPFGNAVMDL